jgi:hypothetical protein
VGVGAMGEIVPCTACFVLSLPSCLLCRVFNTGDNTNVSSQLLTALSVFS